MKNIHVLPTDNKWSRLYFNINDKEFQICEIEKPSTILKPNRQIYITSDEEIKEGDYSFYPPFGVGKNIVIDEEICFHIEAKGRRGSFTQRTYQTLDRNKKIILTTDQSLDAVQAIDNEFLEWFIQNPSCEKVEVDDKLLEKCYTYYRKNILKNKNLYKIIIPKEQSKQENDYTALLQPVGTKQETLEEAFEFWSDRQSSYDKLDILRFGAVWQQERSYSEEEVLELLKEVRKGSMVTSSINNRTYWEFDIKSEKKWFEQFKKK
jgi:hypothetical protein